MQLEAIIAAARREIAARYELIPDVFPDRGSIVGHAREVGSGQRMRLCAVPRARLRVRALEERMERALERAAALRHRHILPVVEHGTTQNLIWWATERAQAPTLARMLAQRGPGRLDGMLAIARQLGNALQYGHQRGVVHGDVCPETVLVDAARTAWLCEFAVSAVLNELTGSGEAVVVRRGPYRAPEVRTGGPQSAATDQYALAAVLHTYLTGTPPFAGEPDAGRARLPDAARDAMSRALHEDPGARYSSVIEFVWALGALETPSSRAAAPEPEPPRVLLPGDLVEPLPTRNRRFVYAAVAVVAFATVALWPGDSTTDVAPLTPPAEEQAAPAEADTVSEPDGTATDAAARERARPPQESRAEPEPAARRESAPPTGERSERKQPPDSVSALGLLSISSMPWGRLFIDDKPAGNTPLLNATLPAGLHRIRIMREGYVPYETVIFVEGGQLVRLVEITLERRNV